MNDDSITPRRRLSSSGIGTVALMGALAAMQGGVAGIPVHQPMAPGLRRKRVRQSTVLTGLCRPIDGTGPAPLRSFRVLRFGDDGRPFTMRAEETVPEGAEVVGNYSARNAKQAMQQHRAAVRGKP